MSKKGQLTLYIIIGIIVLLIIGFTIYILTQEKGKDIEPEIPKIHKVIYGKRKYVPYEPNDLIFGFEKRQASKIFDNAVKKTGINGLNLLGSQGGYIDTSKLSYNSQDPTAKASNAILFSQEGSLVVPYWHYMSSDNKCEESPTLFFLLKYLSVWSYTLNSFNAFFVFINNSSIPLTSCVVAWCFFRISFSDRRRF